jgi:hypothetical protein
MTVITRPEDLLGKRMDDPEVSHFLRGLGATVVEDVESDETRAQRRHFSAERAGIAVVTDTGGIINTISNNSGSGALCRANAAGVPICHISGALQLAATDVRAGGELGVSDGNVATLGLGS